MTIPSTLRSWDDVPLFPLPAAVLFPTRQLPLLIFEQRYRAMTRDVLRGERLLVIATILPSGGTDEHGQPLIAPVAGLGHVIDHVALPDGRFELLLEGLARVAISELPFVPPYRRAALQELVDDGASASESDRMALLSVANRFAAFVRTREPRFQLELPPTADAGEMADICADSLLLDTGSKLAVLTTLDEPSRVELCTHALLTQEARLRKNTPQSLS